MESLRSLLPVELKEKAPKMVTHEFCRELIRTPEVPIDRLDYLVNYLTGTNWKHICEERSTDLICGWPLCSKSIESSKNKPLQVLDIVSSTTAKMVDQSEKLWYCCKKHRELSSKVFIVLKEEPWWLRVSHTRPVDLSWLRELYPSKSSPNTTEIDSTLKSLQKIQIKDVTEFDIIENNLDQEKVQSSKINLPNSQPETSFDNHPELKIVKSISPSSSPLISAMTKPGQERSPNRPKKKVSFQFQDEQLQSDLDQSSSEESPRLDLVEHDEDSFSSSEQTDDDGDTDFFFNSELPKKRNLGKIELTPAMQVMNILVNWVTFQTQKFCSNPDYIPHMHTTSLNVKIQTDDEDEDEEENPAEKQQTQTRLMPAVDSIHLQQVKRRTVQQFITTRLTSIAAILKTLDKPAVSKSLDVLLTTFDYTIPIEGLKTPEWSMITLALLLALSKRHPDIPSMIDKAEKMLSMSFDVDMNAVRDVQSLFKMA